MTRLNRNDYVDIDFQAIKEYEIKVYGSITNTTKRQYIRCDQTKIARKKGCQRIGVYDGNSVLHYPPTLKTQVIEDGNYVNKHFRVFSLKDEAHALCSGGRCTPGQRRGLSKNDIADIKALYGTSCSRSKNICQFISICDLFYRCFFALNHCFK